MTPGIHNIEAKQGGTLVLRLNWLDESNTPVDLSGYRARLVVRHSVESPNALLQLDSAGVAPTITLGGATWNIVATASKTLMLAMKPGRMLYDLELTDSEGIDYPLLTGRFNLTGSTVQS